MLTTTETVVLLVLAALVVIGALGFMSMRNRRNRHEELRRRFGPEYERAINQHNGNVARAERDLVARERRVQKLKLHPLDEGDRVRFAADWSNLQTRFVDDPSGAVTAADDLIGRVMLARGYDGEALERRVEDLSVEHANVIEHYRAARVLADANREGRANTEELRQAFVHYRALFADLLEKHAEPNPHMQEVRA
jgi:hypothetical protein